MTITICENSDDGHRAGYVRYFMNEAARLGSATNVEPSLSKAARLPGTLVIPMLEQRSTLNLFVMSVRALMGRPTLCLVFRAADAARTGGVRMAIKRALLRFARSLPRAGLVSIMPVPVEPRIDPLVNGWLYDPELCDLELPTLVQEPGKAALALRAEANGRRIVVALGRQSGGKGFDFFSALWNENPVIRERFLFVSGGSISDELKLSAAQFEKLGGVLIDRRIDDEELFELYRASDLVWSCYAPDYDQASGIFGRSVQFDKPAIVRKDSYLERFAKIIEHPVCSIDWFDTKKGARDIISYQPEFIPSPGKRNQQFSAHNQEVLAPYLR